MECIQSLIDELTMYPEDAYTQEMGIDPKPFPLYRWQGDTLIVPKYFGLQRFGVPPNDDGAWEARVPDRPFPSFVGSLRNDQQSHVVSKYLSAARDPTVSGGIITLPCGGGKTVVALYIAASLGVKTMIVAHKEFLLEQWRERIGQFLPDARVGLLKASVVDTTDKDIVLASLQSLSMKTYAPDAFEDIGLLVVDECHRIGTEVFSRALFKVTCRYSLGLSATLNRKDGMSRAIVHHLGPAIDMAGSTDLVSAPSSGHVVIVKIVKYRDNHTTSKYYNEEVTYRKGPDGQPKKFINLSLTISNVCNHSPRNACIASIIRNTLAETPSRKILILSDRKQQLRYISNYLDDTGISYGFYWGDSKPADLVITRSKQVICATYPYASEGMDIPEIDTLILASPKSDVVQSCGRILRGGSGANAPLIWDVIDPFFGVFLAQARKRQRFYKSQRFKTEVVTTVPETNL